MKRTDFVIIPAWMYELDTDTLEELTILAKIYNLTSDGVSKTNCTISYLGEISKCTKRGVQKILDKLFAKKYITRSYDIINGVKQIRLAVTDYIINYLQNEEEQKTAEEEKRIIQDTTKEVLGEEPTEEIITAVTKVVKKLKSKGKQPKAKAQDPGNDSTEKACNWFVSKWNEIHDSEAYKDTRTCRIETLTDKRKELINDIFRQYHLRKEDHPTKENFDIIYKGIRNAMKSEKAQGKIKGMSAPADIDYMLKNFLKLIENTF